jgi:hypothetical protein
VPLNEASQGPVDGGFFVANPVAVIAASSKASSISIFVRMIAPQVYDYHKDTHPRRGGSGSATMSSP